MLAKMIFLVATAILLMAGLGSTADKNSFFYDAQGNWTGICVDGNAEQQSPVDIITDLVREDSNLIDLQMTGWDTSVNGDYSNTNTTVLFTLDDGESVTTTNHIGTYNLLQFHIHWGDADGEGSEHEVDGEQAELEIHFVHSLPNPGSERNSLAVIGVFGDVDEDASLTSPWTEIDPTQIVESGSDAVTITGLVLNQLLPDLDNLEYWYYEGSLTTPPCDESVAWFVLKDRITVPSAFLEKLRDVETSPGEPLGSNYRMTQNMGIRRIATQSSAIPSSQVAIPAFSLVVLISALQLIGL